MSIIRIQLTLKGLRLDVVQTFASTVVAARFPKASIQVTNVSPPEARRERFDAMLGLVSEANNEMQALRDEMQEWLDNLPENLQDSDKASQLQDAIDNLETIIGALDEAEGTDVEFPGMY